MSEVTVHLDGDPVVKERDFYRAKLEDPLHEFVLLSMTFRNSKREIRFSLNE